MTNEPINRDMTIADLLSYAEDFERGITIYIYPNGTISLEEEV